MSRWELLVAVVLGWAVWNVAEPPIRTFILRTRRAEVGMVLESLQALAQDRGDIPGAGPFPRSQESTGPDRVAWTGQPAGFLPPSASARGSYTITHDAQGLLLTGACDVDGDGVRASYSARPWGPITRHTPPDVF